MLAQITLPAKWSYAPVTVKFVSYAPVALRHPLYLRGGAVSLPSKAERLAVEWHASSPSKIEGVAQGPGAYESNYDRQGRMKVTMTDGVV